MVHIAIRLLLWLLIYEDKLVGIFLCQALLPFGHVICSMPAVSHNSAPVSDQEPEPWPGVLGSSAPPSLFFVFKIRPVALASPACSRSRQTAELLTPLLIKRSRTAL